MPDIPFDWLGASSDAAIVQAITAKIIQRKGASFFLYIRIEYAKISLNQEMLSHMQV